MIFIDDKQQEHDRSTKVHATNIRITNTTRHQKCFSTSNTKVKARTTLSDREKRSGQHDAYLDETLRLGVAMRRDCCFRDVMTFSLMNNIGYIFIVRRLGKQSKLMYPHRTLSLTQSELNLRIHGPHGPNTRAGADS